MFEYIFKNYKNLPLEIDNPSGSGKIPNSEILQNNDVYQYFTKELNLTFFDPTIKDVTNEYLKEYFTIAVLKINRDLTNFQLSTETKWNTLSNDDKHHLRNAICLLIKHIFDKGNDSFQINKSYSISPINVSDYNQFLKFEYSEAVLSEMEQVSVFFLAKVAKKRENQLGYDDKFFKAVRDTFYDLFIDNYPSTANVLVSKLLESKDFEDFIKRHAKGDKGDKGDPGSGGPVILPKTNTLLTYNSQEEGGINQYTINKDNKDNRAVIQSRLLAVENKEVQNNLDITTNRNDIGRLQTNLNTTNRNVDAIEQAEQTLRTQVSANTRLSNNNKTRLDNIGTIGNFIKFNGTNVEFWNQNKRLAEWYHTESDTDVHLIKFYENLSLVNNKITDLAMPLFDNDAANKKYVDNEITKNSTKIRSLESNLNTLERDGIDALTDKSRFGKVLTQNSQIQEQQKLRVFPSELGIVRSYRTLSGAEINESSFRNSSMDFYSPGINILIQNGQKVNPAAFVITDLNNLDLLNNQILIIKDGTFEPNTQRNYPSIISDFKPLRDRDIIRKQDLDDAISKIPSGGGEAKLKNGTLTKNVDIRITPQGETEIWGVKAGNTQKILYTRDGILYIAEPDSQQATLTLSSGTLNLSGKRITNLGAPLIGTDAANRQYILDEIAKIPSGDAKFKNGNPTTDLDVRASGTGGYKNIEFYDSDGNKMITFYDLGPYSKIYISKELDLSGSNQIKRLKAGVADTDATNLKQVKDLIAAIPTSNGGDVTFKDNTTKTTDIDLRLISEGPLSGSIVLYRNNNSIINFSIHNAILLNQKIDMFSNKIENLAPGTEPDDAVNKKQLDDAITSSGGIKKFSVVIKNNRQPYIVDNTTGEDIYLTRIPSGLKTQIELNFPLNSIINNSRWKVLCEFVPTVEDIQTVGDNMGDFITIVGLIVPNDPSPIDNMIYVDVWDSDFKEPGTTFNATEYHISQQRPVDNSDKWNYVETQTLENMFMLIHIPKYIPELWNQPHLKRKFKFDFESQFIDNKRNNYIAIESQMKNQGKLYLSANGATRLSKNLGIQKIDIMTKINVEHIINKSDIQNIKIYFQKMIGSRTSLDKSNFNFIEPGNGTKLTFILEEKFEDVSEPEQDELYEEQDEA